MVEIIKTNHKEEIKKLSENLLKNIYSDTILTQKLNENTFNKFLLQHYFLVENEQTLAYLALYYNQDLRFKEKKTFTIGHYEAIENNIFAQKIINEVAKEVKNQDGNYLIANMKGSTWYQYRFSLHNDFPNFFLEPYHPIYYNQHFINAGFEVIERYFSSIDKIMQYDNPAILAKEKFFFDMGVKIRTINLNDFANELQKIFTFSAKAFTQNFLYTPIDENVFMEQYLPLKPFLCEDFVLIAEDNQGKTIGVFFALPDRADNQNKTLIIKSIARDADEKWQGLGHVIGNILYRNGKQNGFTQIIHAFMRENGYSTQISKNYSGEIYKNYALYGKSLSNY